MLAVGSISVLMSQIGLLGTIFSHHCGSILLITVELRRLELIGTVGASSIHLCVRAIPSLTISSWFMCTLCHHGHHVFYRPKLQIARDTCH